MDKARDVRRGASRFKHSSGLGGFGGNSSVFSEKSKKEKLKKLSAVGISSSSHEDCEMGCDASDREDDQLRSPGSSKRFKLSEKLFDECNGVGHSSIPRRLRSAMKKRGRDSLPDSKKLNYTTRRINSPKMDVVKKPKSNMQQGESDKCLKRTVSGPITKDEEEVAETLYALAGMFRNDDLNDKSTQNNESLEANPSDFPESKDSGRSTCEEKNVSLVCPLVTAEAAGPSSSVERPVKVDSLNVPSSSQDEPNLPHPKKLRFQPDDSISQVNLHIAASWVKSEEQCDVKPICTSVKFCIPSEPHIDSGFKQPQQKEASLLERKPENALGMATRIGSQMETLQTDEESKKSGLALWSGLPSTVSQRARVDDPCFPSSADKFPGWLDVTSCAPRTSPFQNDSIRKVSKVPTDRRLSKRSATHVYISRLIQALKMLESKDRLPQLQNQLRPCEEGFKQGDLLTINNINGVKNGLNRLACGNSTPNSISDKNPNGAKSGVLQHRLHQDQQLSALVSQQCALQKQSLDFLPLSAGGGRMEVNDSSGRPRNGFEPLSSLQVPYLHSVVQHQFHAPFSLPPSCYNSSPYPDYLSSALQVHSYGNPFYSTQASPTTLTKQQQQQQQQRLWVAARARPDDTPKATVQFLNWQNGASQRQQQQQPQLMSVTSSSPFLPGKGKVMRQDHHSPSVYEESVAGFRTSALPLQLLCNERL